MAQPMRFQKRVLMLMYTNRTVMKMSITHERKQRKMSVVSLVVICWPLNHRSNVEVMISKSMFFML